MSEEVDVILRFPDQLLINVQSHEAKSLVCHLLHVNSYVRLLTGNLETSRKGDFKVMVLTFSSSLQQFG